jgi:NAD(P)-dependent dehydrogenase (short-subunit alcohol dehydrogenase family)
MQRLKDRCAVITGGTGGLGVNVLDEFLSEGAKVLSTYIEERQLKYSAEIKDKYGSALSFAKADVTKSKQTDRLINMVVKKFGRVDILVNIVGGFSMAGIAETDDAAWDRMFDMNLKSVFLMTRSALPHMIEQDYGRIVNIGARPALHGAAKMSAYGASKAGVLNLTQSAADEMAGYNINVNAIIPGTMDTPHNRKEMPKADYSKWVKPQEIAKVISFLCSSEADSISGAVIPVLGKS